MGPMTGRAAGFCAGYGVPGCQNPVGGRGGMGMGRGLGAGRGFGCGGRGWRNQFHATGLTGWQRAAGGFAPAELSAEQQLAALKSQAEFAEKQLDGIRQRIHELETKTE
jgi:hypothetical protein